MHYKFKIVLLLGLELLFNANITIGADLSAEESPAVQAASEELSITPAQVSELATEEPSSFITQESEVESMDQNVNIGLDQNIRTQIAQQLNMLLANEYILYTKTLNYHWNIEGKHFGALHELFNRQYEKLLETVDAIAERIRALGTHTQATLTEFMKAGSVPEKPGTYPNDLGMIADLVAGHEEVIRQMRTINDLAIKLNDAGTNNFLSGLLEMHEKMAWMLRAHLVNKK